MTPEIAQEEFVDALETCAAELLWEAGCHSPPIDAFRVAQRLGLMIVEDSSLTSRGRYARLATTPIRSGTPAESPAAAGVISMASEDRFERRHWAVAHEIGEWASQRVFDRLGILPQHALVTARESVANGLASRLLLPLDLFVEDAQASDWDLFALKSQFKTASHELIARRILELYPSPAIVTVLDHGEITWRRTNYARPSRVLSPDERHAWRVCSREAVPTDLQSHGDPRLRVRSWPVHEPGWRREIMLSELPEFD